MQGGVPGTTNFQTLINKNGLAASRCPHAGGMPGTTNSQTLTNKNGLVELRCPHAGVMPGTTNFQTELDHSNRGVHMRLGMP